MEKKTHHINPNLQFKAKSLKDASYYIEGIKNKKRFILSEAITIIERQDEAVESLKLEILSALRGNQNSIRIGITGAPGVGKSSIIDVLGESLVKDNKSVAVLPIDPSSNRSQGSILGDKTRMYQLSQNDQAFIRPSPSSNLLGGVAPNSKEVIHLCEAFGFDVIIIETVGVGQSETKVENLVDQLIVLLQPASGDGIQGIKRGIMEMGDLFVVNKNDGDLVDAAKKTATQYAQSLKLMQVKEHQLPAQVLKCSALENNGIEELIAAINAFNDDISNSHFKSQKRKQQELDWLSEKQFNEWYKRFKKDEHLKGHYHNLIEKFNISEINIYDAFFQIAQLIKA